MTTLSYHDEDGLAAVEELQQLLRQNYEELCVTKEFEIEPDWDAYKRIAAAGMLRTVVCRVDGVAVGYAVFIIHPHLHYKSCKTAFEDVYFIDKAYRKGRVGIKLFQYAEQVLKRCGVNRIIMHTKIHMDNSRLFEYLGYKLTDKLFTKMLG